MKTILIPTDFTVASLQPLKLTLDSHPSQEYKVVLMFAQLLSDSITELLFYSPQKNIQQLMNEPFKEGLEILQNRYVSQLGGVKIEMFNGRNLNALKGFTEALRIDEVILPNEYSFQYHPRSFDPIPLLKRLNIPQTVVDCIVVQRDTAFGQLDSLFH